MRNVFLALAFLSLPAFADDSSQQYTEASNEFVSRAPYDYESCVNDTYCGECLAWKDCAEDSKLCAPALQECIGRQAK